MTDRDLLELVPLWPNANYDLQRDPLLIEFKCMFDGVFTEVLFRPEQLISTWTFRVEVYRFDTVMDFHKFYLVSAFGFNTVHVHELRWWSADHVHQLLTEASSDDPKIPPGIRCHRVKV